MADPAKRNATYEDLKAVPPHLTAEIIFGDLVTHPRPAPPHAVSGNALGAELTGPFQKGRGGPGGWIFMTEPELHLGPHVVVPDLAGWRTQRLPVLPATTYIELAPDWVCEIISPSTESLDRGRKRRIYATYAVKHLWLLNPVEHFVEVAELQDGQWRLIDTFELGGEQRMPPFESVAIDLKDLWPLAVADRDKT